jgi:hypothetical protein
MWPFKSKKSSGSTKSASFGLPRDEAAQAFEQSVSTIGEEQAEERVFSQHLNKPQS